MSGPQDDDFERLLDLLVPGSGRGGVDASGAVPVDAPDFPSGLGLEPRGVIARGGNGWVFAAWDPILRRKVAVKIARPDQGVSAQDLLLAEARRTAALDHPCVLPVHRIVVASGLVCVEFRLAPDTSLDALLADPDALAQRDLPGRLVLLRGPMRAVQFAHQKGLSHGDLHPGNIVLAEQDAVYLVDWAGSSSAGAGGSPVFSGSPTHAAPELLAGGGPSPASDVYSLGVIVWELCAGRSMRLRLRGETLAAFVARWRDRAAPSLPAELVVPAGIPELLAAALAADPAARPDALGLARLLDDALSGAVERTGRFARGDAMLAQARETLRHYEALGRRLDDERQVVAMQQARVPAHAPQAAKRALWQAEDRLDAIEVQRGLVWLDAVRQGVLAGALCEFEAEARDMVAELWWVRMVNEASRGHRREVVLAAHEVQRYDATGRGAVLRAPCRLGLTVAGLTAPAQVDLARLETQQRRLQPVRVQRCTAPVVDLALPPGRYLLTVTSSGRAPLRLPVLLERGDKPQLNVRMLRPDQVGEDWVLIPGGPFLLGGDPVARQPLPRCRPTVGDFFMRKTLVTSAEWQAFLRALPLDEALRRAPAGLGPAGLRTPWWEPGQGAERWSLPPGWDPRWPIVGVDAEDAAAFALWVSARDGRPQRLPTEEEWEKAARGVDGRIWPWGDQLDPIFAHMRCSRAGPPALGPVGAFPVDSSVYGCLDMAGLVREWTASWMDGGQVVVRGGSWMDEGEDLRCAARAGRPVQWRGLKIGFRLASDHPAAEPR